MPLYATLFTMPSATSTLTEAGEWSSELFDSFLPILYIIIGVGIFVLFFRLIARLFR